MRIPLAFGRLLYQLEPTAGSIGNGKLHASSIKRRLTSSFELKNSFFIGSAMRETAIRGYSDVDLFTVFPRHVLKWGDGWISSDTLVRNVRNDLNERFPATEVRRDAQAIVVQFGRGSEPVDVVPAVFHAFKTEHRVPVFLIPDGNGGWLETAPAAHNNYIKAANAKSGGKLRKTIQLLKHWRNARSPAIPLSSIHLELLLANSGLCVGPKGYAACVFEAFDLLRSRECRGLRDPVGLAGTLYAVKTEAQATRLVDAVEHAWSHAAKALVAEHEKDWREALRQWNIVFNGEFPVR
ncbi:SMODS domain-containing nucleotidyltransferase [Noviherbaspirillum sp. ST9]|uniref:SMODS domain-containing nucleotidyltransferase n=1 Tax=Noviherbaspirillum sp. ST9 TaxID=3401606 RepID=UPI003B58B3AD